MESHHIPTWAVWTVTALLAVEFAIAGAMKLRASSNRARQFVRFGYPAWFRPFISLSELAGALGLLWPVTHIYAVAGLSVIMVGAAITLLRTGESRSLVIAPVVTLVLLLILIYAALG